MTETPGLRATGIVKRFAGVPALSGVDLHLARGRVVGLVGHNGAGKSTLLRVLSGAHTADEGTLAIDGREVHLPTPVAALDAGISTVYQELSLLENLTVTQNVFLGREQRRSGTLDRRAMRTAARDLVARFGLDVGVDRALKEYPVATRQLLEIAVAIARDAQFLLLDEPTTSLEGAQVERLLELIRTLAHEQNLGVLLVDHKLDELYSVADDVVALVDGLVRISGPVATVDRGAIIRAIAGDEAVPADEPVADEPVADEPAADEPADADAQAAPIAVADAVPDAASAAPAARRGARPHPADDAALALRVRGLRTSALAEVSLDARPGRVLGIYGLVGAGRTEVLRALVGLDKVTGGTIELHGEPYRPTRPAAAAGRGLVYLTEERKLDGIVGGLDCATNVMLPVVGRYRRLGLLDTRQLRRDAAELMDRMHVRGNRAGAVERLSGGNQQKILLARVLAQNPRVLLLDEPTKGVDIGVKAEIHRLLRALAHEEGLAVVVVSSEEEEILELADDVVTITAGVCDGRAVPAGRLTAVELRHAAWNAA